MRLTKFHGLGNDFLILLDLDGRKPVDQGLARSLCDRHRGVGADGLIRVTAGVGSTDVTMELRNADGSRAEMSGNGVRCLARAVIDAGLVRGPTIVVGTDAGSREVTVQPDGQVTVDMGPATLVDDNSFRGERRSVRVDMGNPHLVADAGDRARLDAVWDTLAPPFREVNVELVAAGPGTDEITMRVWERGVGETEACGTGACAAAAAAQRWGLVGDRVTVHQPGGAALVEIKPETILLTGPAELVCMVEVPWI